MRKAPLRRASGIGSCSVGLDQVGEGCPVDVGGAERVVDQELAAGVALLLQLVGDQVEDVDEALGCGLCLVGARAAFLGGDSSSEGGDARLRRHHRQSTRQETPMARWAGSRSLACRARAPRVAAGPDGWRGRRPRLSRVRGGAHFRAPHSSAFEPRGFLLPRSSKARMQPAWSC